MQLLKFLRQSSGFSGHTLDAGIKGAGKELPAPALERESINASRVDSVN